MKWEITVQKQICLKIHIKEEKEGTLKNFEKLGHKKTHTYIGNNHAHTKWSWQGAKTSIKQNIYDSQALQQKCFIVIKVIQMILNITNCILKLIFVKYKNFSW